MISISFVGVALGDLDVEHVDAGELLEQHRLAFHHRLRGERADRAEAEHRGAVGDDADHVAARGVAERVVGIGDDLLARRGDARRIREREVALVRQLLGRRDRDLPGRRELVILERRLAQFGLLVGRRRRGAARTARAAGWSEASFIAAFCSGGLRRAGDYRSAPQRIAGRPQDAVGALPLSSPHRPTRRMSHGPQQRPRPRRPHRTHHAVLRDGAG